MKKVFFIFICTVLLFALSSCDDGDKKMDGFTPTELAEYLSSVEGITPIGLDNGITIQCGDTTLRATNNQQTTPAVKYFTASMKDYFLILTPDNSDGSTYSVSHLFVTVGPNKSYFHDKIQEAKKQYPGEYPNNFAYIIRDCGLNSSPDWTEWVDYGIAIDPGFETSQGRWNKIWYNPITNELEVGHYYRELENSTEVYIVFQEASLFYSWSLLESHLDHSAPFLMSEELYEHLKETYESFRYEHYKKGTVKEFAEWFIGEYTEELPPVFSDIKADYVYYPALGFGILQNFDGHEDEKYDGLEGFISDMEDLGVNFDEIRSYIIKATVPHDGTIQDIFWELIG